MDLEKHLVKPVSRELLHIKVAEAICNYIANCGLRPGDKLPPERALAAEFATGRNTVRDALRALERERVLEIRPGKGAFVAHGPVDGQLQLKLMKVNYRDLLEIKINLEQLAIRRAARSAAPERLRALREAALELCALAERGVYSREVDRKYHTALLECGGNGTLLQLVLTLIDALDGYAAMMEVCDSVWLKTVPFHLQLADALAEGRVSFAIAAHEYIYMHDLRALGALGETAAGREEA